MTCNYCNLPIPLGSGYCLHCGMSQTMTDNTLFTVCAKEWRDSSEFTMTHNSFRSLTAAYTYCVDCFGDKYISEITRKDVKSFVLQLAKKGLAKRTVKNYLFCLRQILSVGIEEYSLNPASNVKLPNNLVQRRREPPTVEDVQTVTECRTLEFGLFAFLIMLTGCRLGEALAIQGRQIDRNNKMLIIDQSIYFFESQPIIKCPKTEAGIREVAIPDILLESLPLLNEKDFLFHSESGKALSKGQYQNRWNKYLKNSGVTTVTPHRLRHEYASLLYEAGIDVKDAQAFLGHSSVAMTMDIYTHLSSRQKTRTVEKFNTYIDDVFLAECK